MPIPTGHAAFTVDEAVAAAGKLRAAQRVVKSQIHAGGRGKGKFKELPPMPRAVFASPSRSMKSAPTPRTCSATRW